MQMRQKETNVDVRVYIHDKNDGGTSDADDVDVNVCGSDDSEDGGERDDGGDDDVDDGGDVAGNDKIDDSDDDGNENDGMNDEDVTKKMGMWLHMKQRMQR